jgi:putative transcriptional regulator
MSMVRVRLTEDGSMVRVLPDGRTEPVTPQFDRAKLEVTTETDIARHEAEDEVASTIKAGQYVRAVRRKVGLSQVMFARKFQIPVDTLRNWEQGKRAPQVPALALLRIIDRMPEAVMEAVEKE